MEREEPQSEDLEIEGAISNGTLLRMADAYAGMKDWIKAKNCLVRLKKKVIKDLENLKTKEGEDSLNEEEKITLYSGTLQCLLLICDKRLKFYSDYGERLISLKELVLSPWCKDDDLEKRTFVMRYKLSLFSLPEVLWQPVGQIIRLLSLKNQISPQNICEYKKLTHIVFAYITDYFAKVDPENVRSFIAIDSLKPEPEYQKSRAAQTENPLATEYRIKNRAKHILQREKAFIDKNEETFQKLQEYLYKVV